MSAAPHRRRFRGSDPRRKAAGWAVVIAVHAFIGWALVSGTARKTLERSSKPMEAALIQEVIIPPPAPPAPPPPPRAIEPPKPPPPKPAPPRKVEPPKPRPRVVAPPPRPPPVLPAPEVPPPPAPDAVAVPSAPLPAPSPSPVAPLPAAAPAPAPMPAPTQSAPSRPDMTVVCPEQVRPEMPRRALREGIQGIVKAQALIRDGVVQEVTILSGPRVYHAPVREAMLQYRCVGAGEVIATQEFVFRIE